MIVLVAFLFRLLFGTLPLPGFGPEPEDLDEPSGYHRPPRTQDDGGWKFENPAWSDYPPHFKGWRSGQYDAVAEIVGAFEAGARTVLVDGQTGVGKTFIANGVRAELARLGRIQTCTYSCHSLALQDQWLDDFAPYPVLKGRSNYPITWPGTPRFVTAADCTWNAANPSAGCHWCPEKPVCPYERQKNRAIVAPFRCVNHAYLVTEAAHVGRFLSATKPTDLLIIDEAEMLEHSILQQVSVSFPAKVRDDLCLGKPKFVTKEESIKEWLQDVVIPALKRDFAMYPKETTDRKVIRQRDTAANRLQATQFVLSHYDNGWVFDHSGDTWSLRPVWASHWGAKWIGTRAKRILAMSATLISGDQVAEDLGLPEPRVTVSITGGFDPGLRPIYLAPVCDLRSKGEEGQPKAIPQAEIDKLIIGVAGILARHPRDRILIHCHTYKLARQIYAGLDSPRLMMYDPGGRDEALQAYLQADAAVLVAPSLERGVNLPDDLCRVVVWAKVPFPNLGDPVVRRRRYSGGPTGARWYSVETIRAVVQGCGRAVRHNEDWAETYILDSAFMGIWRKDKRLLPAWFSAAVRTNVDVRSLLRDGERYLRVRSAAKNARLAAGMPIPQRRPAITGPRSRRPT